MRGFLRVLLYALAGPYVGMLAMAVLIGSYTLLTTGSPRDFLFGPELFAPGILLVTYSIGSIPALLTGIAAIFVARRFSGWRNWLLVALIGGVVSLIGSFAVVGGGPEMIAVSQQNPVIVLLALAGVLAGFVCAMVFDGFASLAGGQAG